MLEIVCSVGRLPPLNGGAAYRALADCDVEIASRSADMSDSGVSSSEVLKLLRGGFFAELQESKALHPAVLAYLRESFHRWASP